MPELRIVCVVAVVPLARGSKLAISRFRKECASLNAVADGQVLAGVRVRLRNTGKVPEFRFPRRRLRRCSVGQFRVSKSACRSVFAAEGLQEVRAFIYAIPDG